HGPAHCQETQRHYSGPIESGRHTLSNLAPAGGSVGVKPEESRLTLLMAAGRTLATPLVVPTYTLPFATVSLTFPRRLQYIQKLGTGSICETVDHKGHEGKP